MCACFHRVVLGGEGIQCCLVTVMFRYYTVSMHDAGNCNMGKSAVKCQGNVREFHNTEELSPCF